MGVASRDPFQVVIQVQQYFTKGTHDVQTNQLQQKSEHVIYQPFFNNYSTLHVSQRCKYHMYNITYIYMIFMNVYHTRYSFCTSNITWMFTLSRMCMPVNIPTDAEYITDCYFVFNQNAKFMYKYIPQHVHHPPKFQDTSRPSLWCMSFFE